jgi:hypothetical protein
MARHHTRSLAIDGESKIPIIFRVTSALPTCPVTPVTTIRIRPVHKQEDF